MLILEGKDIPGDLIEYFEPVDITGKRDVLNVSTKPYHGAHFATFPPDLVEPCIKAGSSEHGVCPECGAPWERVVKTSRVKHPNTPGKGGRQTVPGSETSQSSCFRTGLVPVITTTGWRPTCDHDADPIPCTVLDPFAGSGTTGEVARALGRDAVLLDLSHQYLVEQATTRLELDRLREWNGQASQPVDDALDDLPLFG